MQTRWQRERKREYYYKRAKKEGFRARSSYKLLQIDKIYHIFKNSSIILDLGCAPGGWLQVCKQKAKNAFILGIDLESIQGISGVEFIQGDITKEGDLNKIRNKLQDKADLILSDCSPSVSGVWSIDHARQLDLVKSAYKISIDLLKNKGIFVCKIFQGEDFNEFIKEIKAHFSFLALYKPEASRKKSSEIYVVAKNLKN